MKEILQKKMEEVSTTWRFPGNGFLTFIHRQTAATGGAKRFTARLTTKPNILERPGSARSDEVGSTPTAWLTQHVRVKNLVRTGLWFV
ncbi:hypothetical protein ILYODFUR_001415 [Ilyodon furcidens]|uniref:Uncharacterized protein n=1 Tax=Ilyodon furcidens TaxID=33524 RepID=A0ABV0STD2_9TELE